MSGTYEMRSLAIQQKTYEEMRHMAALFLEMGKIVKDIHALVEKMSDGDSPKKTITEWMAETGMQYTLAPDAEGSEQPFSEILMTKDKYWEVMEALGNADQLIPVVKDANDVVLPPLVAGALQDYARDVELDTVLKTPPEWRTILVMESFTPTDRESYEDTPMTREAFKIYDKGVKTPGRTDVQDWRPANRKRTV